MTELQVPQPGGGSYHPGLLSSGTDPGSTVVFSTIYCGQAFRGGITAGQIIKFLQQQVHSSSLASPGPPVPPTVTDQIRYTHYITLSCSTVLPRLWEKERDRFVFTEGVLYNQFLSHQDYETVKNYAEARGLVVWSKETHSNIGCRAPVRG